MKTNYSYEYMDKILAGDVTFLQRAAKLALKPLYMLRHIRVSVCPSVCPSHSGIVSNEGTQRYAVFTTG